MIQSIESALVADDDILMREFVVETLSRSGVQVTQVGNGLEAKNLLAEKHFDLSFLDLKMPGMDGMQVLKFIKETNIETLPVIITAFGTVEKAVEAMKMGAYDFLMKPFSPEQVEIIIKRTKEWVNLQAQNAYLEEELGWRLPHGRQIVGQSEVIQKLMKDVEKVSKSSSSVLISGESGTGKELIARAIHFMSDRRDKPFIRMNCAAVPDTLMDSELFGHEKGAFTSAVATRLGRFELAHRGTLLLDEISEMPLGLQAKLLRVLQEQEFERVGGSRTIKVDCRIIATTNRNLKDFVDAGKFRQDLFYRLNVVPVVAPPLSARREDIPLLVNAFIERRTNAKDQQLAFTARAMEALQSYDWPGNVRELENLVERLCVMEEGPELDVDVLPFEVSGSRRESQATAENQADTPAPAGDNAICTIAEMEREAIIKTLRHTEGNKTRAAELLGVSIRTLRNKLNEYKAANLLPEDL